MAALGDLQMFGRSLDRAFLVLLTVGTVTYAWIAVYHLLLHPLRKIPGPRLARISRLWARIGNLDGRKAEKIHAAHQRFGCAGPSTHRLSD